MFNMKHIIAAIALLGVVGCVPQLPKVPEIPEVEIPEVEIPEVEVPTTLPFPTAPESAFPSVPAVTDLSASKSMCIAGFVETSTGIGAIDIYAPSKWSPQVQSIPGVSTAVIPELDLDPC